MQQQYPTAEMHKQVFFPYLSAKQKEFQEKKLSFIYYTTAATAVQIIRNRQIWMRSTGVMNDHTEVSHGISCIRNAFESISGKELSSAINNCHPNTYAKLLEQFNNYIPLLYADTFITCLSEHESIEVDYGRLSMWRAYGGHAGVALVLNPYIFFSETTALAAYTSPVLYADEFGVQERLSEVAASISANRSYAKSLHPDAFRNSLFQALRFAAICTKHPAFIEEREWRIASSPAIQSSDYVTKHIEVIGGVPQTVLKLELNDQPDEGIIGLEPSTFVEKILIGPCDYPETIARALADELKAAGFSDPYNVINVTGIPLRPNQR
jgi:hypothetical protein